jgi:hypothetical protein
VSAGAEDGTSLRKLRYATTGAIVALFLIVSITKASIENQVDILGAGVMFSAITLLPFVWYVVLVRTALGSYLGVGVAVVLSGTLIWLWWLAEIDDGLEGFLLVYISWLGMLVILGIDAVSRSVSGMRRKRR